MIREHSFEESDRCKPGTHAVGIAVLLYLFIHIASCVAGQDTLFLKKYAGNLKAIDVSINGIVYLFLFDTGGGETLIAPEVAEKINKTPYGSITGFRMHGEMIRYQKADGVDLVINSTHLYHPSIGVWDVMSVLPPELPRLDGVLSLKSFVGRRITLDLSNDHLILETGKSYRKRITKMTQHRSRFANGLAGNEVMIFLEERNAGRSFWFLLDSGNLGNTLFSPSTVAAWGLDADPATALLGEVPLTLGNTKMSAESRQDKIIYDGVLNYNSLINVTILIDLVSNEVWIGNRF